MALSVKEAEKVDPERKQEYKFTTRISKFLLYIFLTFTKQTQKNNNETKYNSTEFNNKKEKVKNDIANISTKKHDMDYDQDPECT